ncbi:MAG TPA: LLM class flavin-dependent oxidoreductase [Acetobacteraceae bacterium]|jgi:alkanesulfonate monooxygenase|nr:LLM class flavin-dependent oxidoreductase [Acetobacteraceae bacterium]
MPDDGIRIFSTCPQSKDVARGDYLAQVQRVARWSEAAGCTGMLIYTDNSIVDPWLVAQLTLQCTERLCPLVAVQPIYMLPYTAAKMVASLGALHGRRVWLNMLAGGFRNDLISLGDETPHDDRYARTVEYALLMRDLLENDAPVNFDGRFYRVHGARLAPPLPGTLQPGWLISGSSAAGRAAAVTMGAIAVEYPAPPDVAANHTDDVPAGRGIRVGIIARDSADEAWAVAHARFPDDRRGRLSHALAMKTSDSAWHRTLSELAHERPAGGSPYWLWPFEQHRTFCPYLVGDFVTVAQEIARYLALGHRSFILDIPLEADDLATAAIVFRMAQEQASPSAAMVGG